MANYDRLKDLPTPPMSEDERRWRREHEDELRETMKTLKEHIFWLRIKQTIEARELLDELEIGDEK